MQAVLHKLNSVFNFYVKIVLVVDLNSLFQRSVALVWLKLASGVLMYSLTNARESLSPLVVKSYWTGASPGPYTQLSQSI